MEHYLWDDPFLYKRGPRSDYTPFLPDLDYTPFVPEDEQHQVLESSQSAPYGGHFVPIKTAANCDKCERIENISWSNKMPLNSILDVEIFDIWGIDFIGPFPSSYDQQYILVVVDYMSK